ncbi:MAG TPA: hypothetical protein VHF01_19025 [Candidatus Acidoferrum sp.]|nr:hypothetical protein [Candidatus Acidoferrum sp.]
MTEFGAWIQTNWFKLGILVLLSAILATIVWFARNILRTLRASQEQVGALLRLSFSDVIPVQATETELPAPVLSEPLQHGPSPLVVFAGNLFRWFQAPMGSGSVAAPWRKVLRWLQAPAGS